MTKGKQESRMDKNRRGWLREGKKRDSNRRVDNQMQREIISIIVAAALMQLL